MPGNDSGSSFLAQWAVMMAVMMIPAVVPVAERYRRMIRTHRILGLVALVVGFLAVWAATGVPAWLLRQRVAVVPAGLPLALTTAALYVVCGVYQFSTLKDRCLAHCRAPGSLLLQYAGWRGRWRHLRVGLHHGLYCAGCCWPLFAMMTLLGATSLPLMALVTAIILLERFWAYGYHLSRVVALVAFLLAAAVLRHPALASGLPHPGMTMAPH